jgi:hypothetical protein
MVNVLNWIVPLSKAIGEPIGGKGSLEKFPGGFLFFFVAVFPPGAQEVEGGLVDGLFWWVGFEDANLQGLAFAEGEGNGGFEDACFVGDGEVGHGGVVGETTSFSIAKVLGGSIG